MNLSSFFIHRPIATTLLAIGMALAGVMSFKLLSVAALPQIEFPTIVVKVSLPGASPEVMATSVATPLERQISHIAGISEITSVSSVGNAKVTIQFDLGRNIDGAARDVQAAIDAASSQLPTDLPGKPTYMKVNPSDSPILALSLTSDIYTVGQMYDAASTILQQKISQVEGVGQVVVAGSSLPAVRIELNPTSLNKYGISLPTASAAVASANTLRPKGQLTKGERSSEILTNDQIFQPNDYKSLIIGFNNGAPVRLSDVTESIHDSVEDIHNAGLADGKPAVILVLYKQPGVNIIETVNRVLALLPSLKASIPEAMDITIVNNRTVNINASIKDVEFTLILSMFLVIAVVYAFFRKVRAALIPSIVVPLSLLGTFCIMYLCGYSLDNLSLMALTIATGFVVDDAVVVLENIERHIEEGLTPIKAALVGVKEVGFTILSMSISLIAVFIPILLMSGIVGRLFREFAVVLSIAILVSLVVSLSVTPMMCAHILRSKDVHATQGSEKKSLIHLMRDVYYAKSLRWVLKHKHLMLMLTAGMIFFNIFLFIIIPKGFFPQQDAGQIVGIIQADQNISFHSLKKKLEAYAEIIGNDPAVRHIAGFVGGSGASAITNTGNMFINLKPREERDILADKLIERLREKVSHVPGASFYMQASQDLVIGGRQGNAQFQYTLTAQHLEDLNKWVPTIIEKFRKIDGLVDLSSDQLSHGLEAYVTIDRDTAARFGITATEIDKTLYGAFGQHQVSTMYTMMNQYHVVMGVAPHFWERPESLKDIYIASTTGKQIPLSILTNSKPRETLLSINHQSQIPSVTFSFNLRPGAALGDVANEMKKVIEGLQLPSTIKGSFQGVALAFQKSLATQTLLILVTLLAVYIVLGMLYESYIHPVTILSTLPSAGVGALLALLLTGIDLSIIALIGIILLIGIVKKNAIMMIDFALDLERTQNKSPNEAIYEACLLRFRPIMMTTLAALFSAVPLAIGEGVGSELRHPLGVSIIGGLIVSQMLTLYTTPVIYLSFEDWSLKMHSFWRRFLPFKPNQNPGHFS